MLSQAYRLTPQTGKNVVAIKGPDAGGIAGLLAEIRVAGQRLGSNATWKVSLTARRTGSTSTSTTAAARTRPTTARIGSGPG